MAPGGMSTQCPTMKTDRSSAPNRPMSWCSGSQLTVTTPRRRSYRSSIRSRLASTDRWLSTTPRGARVAPEVNWRIAVDSGPTSGGVNPWSSAGARSVSSTGSRSGSSAGPPADEVSWAAGAQAAVIASTRARAAR